MSKSVVVLLLIIVTMLTTSTFALERKKKGGHFVSKEGECKNRKGWKSVWPVITLKANHATGVKMEIVLRLTFRLFGRAAEV